MIDKLSASRGVAVLLCVVCLLSGCGKNIAYGYEETASWKNNVHELISDTETVQTVDENRTWYEVFVYSFYDSDGDGIGDINGITQMLDYISYMGFDGIWLMPIHPSPTYHKYDVTDYYAIDPAYGTIEDFDRFMEACDERGIAVMMDFVINHTSSEHDWFIQAKEALAAGEEDNPYVSYYHFSKMKGNGRWEKATGEWYYECQFWSGMPDLNLDNPELKKELEKVMEFWLNKGVSGLRLDAVREYETGNQDKNMEIMRWVNETAKSIRPDTYVVGEAWDTSIALYQLYDSGLDSFFNFPFAMAEGKLAKSLLLKSQKASDYADALVVMEEEIHAHNPNGVDAPFFTNHDTARAVGIMRQQPELIKTAWGMNLMQAGNVFVYYGEEIGMSGSGIDENKRQPMRWTDGRSEGTPYPPPNSESVEHKFPPLNEQIQDDQSILQYVRSAIHIRKKYPEIAGGRASVLAIEGGDKVSLLMRTLGEEKVYLVYNLGSETEQISLDLEAEICDGLYTAQEEAVYNEGMLTLPPYSIVIMR